MTEPTAFMTCMARGSALFEAGQPEQALVAFQQALALEPQDVNAASACATLLSGLNLPQAAYQVLASLKAQLWQDADGAANLAISAEACGLFEAAWAAYHRALVLDPNHVRSLNNLALWAMREGRWDEAVARAAHCVVLAPAEPMLWANWADFLTGAGHEADALTQLERACERFPSSEELAVRRMVSRAFNGQFEAARQAQAALGPDANAILNRFLQQATAALPKPLHSRPIGPPLSRPSVEDFFSMRAFEAMHTCDWRHHDTLTALLSRMVDPASAGSPPRDWREAQFYALMLPLSEAQQTCLGSITAKTILAHSKATPDWRPLKHHARRDERIHIGIATQNLASPQYADTADHLLAQLALHDATRFSFTLYTPAGPAPAEQTARFLQHATSVTAIGHMTDAEAAARVRLDRLDLWMDTTFYTPWWRPELPTLQVAPIQLCQQTWQRAHQDSLYHYTVGDTFTHPAREGNRFGAVARLPHTCWLAAWPAPKPTGPVRRADVGLPAEALVLCCQVSAVSIDPETFGKWMHMLRALPDAVLWLPTCAPAAQGNLVREASAAGVAAWRLVFTKHHAAPETQVPLALADLFVDTLRFNASQGLANALSAGVPAITCAGHTMASRLGGSIIRASGLADCVFDNIAAYTDAAISLGRNREALGALRARLQQAHATASLFSPMARLREWEAMWTHMVLRQRAGLPPQAFDVSAARPT